MIPNQTYYSRNTGQWDWRVSLTIISLRALWKTKLSMLRKIQLSIYSFVQYWMGPGSLLTEVYYKTSDNIVYHRTCLSKWGIPLLKGEERIHLNDDGINVTMEGNLFYWPFLFIAVPFSNYEGKIESCTCKAKYNFPFFSIAVPATTQLDGKVGVVQMNTLWMKCTFELTKDSLRTLKQRFAQNC